MANTYSFGGDAISNDRASNDIFAAPYNPFKTISVTMGTLTSTDYNRGQVLVQNSDGTFNAAANKAAVAAATSLLAIILNDVDAAETGTITPAIIEGNFIQQKLTPSDIPLGAYSYGNIIIGKEVD